MKTKTHTIKNTLLKIVIWSIAALVVLFCISLSAWAAETKPMTDDKSAYTVEIRIPDGMTIKEAAKELQEQKVIRSSDAFYFAARFRLFDHGKNFILKSGVYTISSSMSMNEIYTLIQSGDQDYITVSIPEGLTMSKIGALLEEKGVCNKSDFITACSSKDILDEYDIPAKNCEGYLFPDTYFFNPKMESASVVRKMIDTFKIRINTIDSLKKVSPQKLYETIILASIVEREYRVPKEAPLIASVFTNRIKKNIGLYSCATIEYIITEIEGKPHPEKITYDDLKSDSQYNTYKWAGLPPGPISNPGLIALNAAANPAKTNYYYFVLTNPKEGTHTFTNSFDTHIAAENGYYTKSAAGKK